MIIKYMARLYPLKYEPFYNRLSRLTGMSNNEIDMFVLKMIKIIVNDLHHKGKIYLPYLGKFTLKRMPPRKRAIGNLSINKKVTVNIPAQDKLRFKINRKFSKLFL